MSSEFSVSDDVEELVCEMIKKNNWGPVSDVKYYPGTQTGDGYTSKHASVDITTGDKIFRLFVKYALNIPQAQAAQLDKIYANEAYFYDKIYPVYVKFLKKKKINNGFQNVPKCYGTSTKNVIILENLKEKGFTLFNRKEIMNDNHIELTLRTFAKFHATSFAYKDQKREKYDKLVDAIDVDFTLTGTDAQTIKIFEAIINDGIRKFDVKADKHIIEKCDTGVLLKSVMDVASYVDEYSILTQGDCWCNNMMYLYEKENRDCPTDIILVDWQLCREAPPVLDISYFFYTIACEESLNRLDFYLKGYYAELYDYIKILGSDPDKLYPFSVFEKHWKQHSKYGFAMAFLIFKVMLINQDEVPNMREIQVKELQKKSPSGIFSKFSNDDEYITRLRILGDFMVKNDYM